MTNHTTTTAASAFLLVAASAVGASAGDMKKGNYAKMDKAKMEAPYKGMHTDTAAFDAMDVNNNGEVDFTEFSNYLETQYGYDASDSAKEYVKLTTSNNVITDRTFAGMDITKLPHKHKNGTQHNMSGSQSASTMTRTSSQPTAVMGSTATSSFGYGAFNDYDSNADGNVTFAEYSQYRSQSGVRTTQAAQEFIRFSNGNASFTQSDFDMAVGTDVMSRPYYMAR